MKASMPQVRKVLEAVIWRSDTNLDFMPIGSEQPEAFEYTVEVRPGREEETKEREKRGMERKRKKESMIDRGRRGSSPRPASDAKRQTNEQGQNVGVSQLFVAAGWNHLYFIMY